jgi:uncharacterized membrane protein
MIVAGVVVHLFSAVLPFAMIIAVIVGPAFVVWWIVRCVKGMQYVGRREAYSNYDTLFW